MVLLTFGVGLACAENIDPYEDGSQYAYGENIGWLNFEPSEGPGVQVEDDKLTGFVWAENIGWINLHCENNGTCATVAFGVVNDGAGNLSGYGWAENVGWINFDPEVTGPGNAYQVQIEPDGKLSGWAWGENIGWIHFDSAETWDVRVCIVTMEDLANFAADWLKFGAVPGNLDNTGDVDMADFDLFAEEWLDYCPDGWQLK
jgi:hypothetical protein